MKTHANMASRNRSKENSTVIFEILHLHALHCGLALILTPKVLQEWTNEEAYLMVIFVSSQSVWYMWEIPLLARNPACLNSFFYKKKKMGNLEIFRVTKLMRENKKNVGKNIFKRSYVDCYCVQKAKMKSKMEGGWHNQVNQVNEMTWFPAPYTVRLIHGAPLQ